MKIDVQSIGMSVGAVAGIAFFVWALLTGRARKWASRSPMPMFALLGIPLWPFCLVTIIMISLGDLVKTEVYAIGPDFSMKMGDYVGRYHDEITNRSYSLPLGKTFAVNRSDKTLIFVPVKDYRSRVNLPKPIVLHGKEGVAHGRLDAFYSDVKENGRFEVNPSENVNWVLDLAKDYQQHKAEGGYEFVRENYGDEGVYFRRWSLY